jgi:hypothetical protein
MFDFEKKETPDSPEIWTVWVDGTEVIDYLVSKERAERIAKFWRTDGYENVSVETYGCYNPYN